MHFKTRGVGTKYKRAKIDSGNAQVTNLFFLLLNKKKKTFYTGKLISDNSHS